MSLDGVHTDEMPEPSDDLWPAGEPALAALAEDLRIVASGPAPEPRPGLVAVMAQGDVRPSEQEAGRKKMLVKTFLGSLAAKVAMGVGLATASVAAVGATGVLPDAAQHAVASVVSATTPFALPDPSSVTGATAAVDDPSGSTTTSSTSTTVAGGNGSVTSTTIAGTDDDEATGTGAAGEDGADNHGACVSAIAQDKSTSGTDNHGKVVSTVARSDCGKTSTTVPGSTTSSSTSTSTSTTVANASPTSNSGTGKANGNSGNGNSGNGNNGNGKGGKG